MNLHEFVIEGLTKHLGRVPTEEEIAAVRREFQRTNIRSVAIENGLNCLAGKDVSKYSIYVR